MEKPVLILLGLLVAGIIVFGAIYLAIGNRSAGGGVVAKWVPHKGDYLEYTVTGPMVSANVKIKVVDENQTHVKVYFSASGLAAIFPLSNETTMWLPKNNATEELYEIYKNCTRAGHEEITVLGKTLRTIKYLVPGPGEERDHHGLGRGPRHTRENGRHGHHGLVRRETKPNNNHKAHRHKHRTSRR